MKIKILKTTDKKFEGKIFNLDKITSKEIKKVTGKDFDFQIIKYMKNDIVELQSSHYTVLTKIINETKIIKEIK